MRKPLWFLCALCPVWTMVASAQQGEGRVARIVGMVVDTSGRAVRNAGVVLDGQGCWR